MFFPGENISGMSGGRFLARHCFSPVHGITSILFGGNFDLVFISMCTVQGLTILSHAYFDVRWDVMVGIWQNVNLINKPLYAIFSTHNIAIRSHTSYLSFFLQRQIFWKIKLTARNANFLR